MSSHNLNASSDTKIQLERRLRSEKLDRFTGANVRSGRQVAPRQKPTTVMITFSNNLRLSFSVQNKCLRKHIDDHQVFWWENLGSQGFPKRH